jgi:enamine deaminase RidA (YjgF/YER057c/UK114 family)
MKQVVINANMPPSYAKWGIAHAVRCGNLLFLSGQLALAPDGTIVGHGDAAAQTRCVFERLETILREAGCKVENIVKILMMYVNPEDLANIMKVRVEFLSGRCVPASSGFCVKTLAVPHALVEIEVVAVVEE